MQRITVLAVGSAGGFYAAGVAEYTKRLQPLCRFEVVELAEEPVNEKSASPAVIQAALEKEARRILAAVPKSARLYALCIEGPQYTSEAFAALLEGAAQSGEPAVAFAIGSSHGLGDAVKRAATPLSLSRMTLPHQLARLVLAEQVYRAMAIRAGSRYHK